MDSYAIALKILSLFGIFTLVLSMYIFIVVPNKLSAMFQAALIGNSVTNCFFQTVLSLGFIPTALLPCLAFYSNGLMSSFGIDALTQGYIVGSLYGCAGWFMVLICLLRALAVSVYLSEQRKILIISAYYVCAVIHFLIGLSLVSRVPIFEDGDQLCIQKFNESMPPEIFMAKTLVIGVEKNAYTAFMTYFYTCSLIVYLMIALMSTLYLIWRVKQHSAETSSTKLQESQRRLTINVLKLSFFQAMGLGFPPLCFAFCMAYSVSSTILPKILVLMLSINPLIACILMLRLIPAYRERLNEMCLSILPVGLMNHLINLKPQTVSVQVSLNRGINNS